MSMQTRRARKEIQVLRNWCSIAREQGCVQEESKNRQRGRSRRGAVSTRLILYDQQEETKLFGTIQSRGKAAEGRVWSGDKSAQEENDEAFMLCEFCPKCPAWLINSAGECQMGKLFG